MTPLWPALLLSGLGEAGSFTYASVCGSHCAGVFCQFITICLGTVEVIFIRACKHELWKEAVKDLFLLLCPIAVQSNKPGGSR